MNGAQVQLRVRFNPLPGRLATERDVSIGADAACGASMRRSRR
jgi:hypothetical protein